METNLVLEEKLLLPAKITFNEEWDLLSSMFEYSMEPMFLAHMDGSIIYVNSAMCSLIGKDRETLLKEGRAGVMDMTDPRLSVCLETRERTGYFKGELLCRHADGSSLPVELSTSAFQIPSGVTVASIHLRDLRPELRAKQEMEQQKEEMASTLAEFQLIMDNTLDAVCMVNSEGKFTRVNAASIKMWGYSEEELLQIPFIELVHPEDFEETQAEWLKILAGKSSFNFRNRYIHRDGSIVYMEWSSVWSEDKQTAYEIGRDVSKVVEAERVKQIAEERLQALMQASSDIIVILKEDGTYSYIGPSVYAIVGTTEEELLDKNALELVHPEDKSAIEAAFQKALEGETVTTKPYRFPSADASGWSWFEAVMTNCVNNSSIQGILVNIRDITKRQLAEIELKKSEQRYQSLFDFNPDAAYSLDTNGYYTSLNQGAVDIIGVPKEEILQKHFNDFAHPDFREHNERHFQKVLAGEPITTETSVIDNQNKVRHYTYTEIPIEINGEIVGIHGLAKDITESKQQRKLLEETAQKLISILESIQDAFCALDNNGCFTYVNAECLRLLGLEGKQVIGTSIYDFFPENDETNLIYRHHRKATRTQKPVHFVEFLQSAEMWIETNIYPSAEGLSIYFREINDKVKAEEELKKLSLVASKTVNSVYITDDKGRVEWVNEGFTRITGYTLEEVKGCRLGDILPGPATDDLVISSIRDRMLGDKPFLQEVQNRRKDGELYWARLDITPILDDGKGEKKFIVIETVITEQKQAEQERIQLTEEVLHRNRHLEQFTYIVSHNLRAPVANILGITSLLNKPSTQDPTLRTSLIERLHQSSQNLDTIIRDLNDLLSLQHESRETKSLISLPDVVKQALQILPAESIHQVEVELNGLTEVWSVRSYLSSILSNLLSNAVKYRSPERSLKVKLSFELQNEMLKVSVADNGLGINLEKDRKNLFGLYKRFHRHVNGRGLGLYLVKTQAETLGGYVDVDSELGKGTTFHVLLPNN